jgi:tetratricopeptide (TPR) repeat protein
MESSHNLNLIISNKGEVKPTGLQHAGKTSFSLINSIKMHRTMQAPLSATQTMTEPLPSLVNQRALTQEVAANMSNNAARLYAESEYTDALMLYKLSLSLLNEITLGAPRIEEAIPSAAVHKTSEITDFTQTIEIPLDSAYDSGVAPCSDEFVYVAVMYNLFLLLRKKGQTIDALLILDLVHSITETGPDASDWHPTLRLAIKYHFATIAWECGESDESCRMFIQAIEIGQKHLSRHMLYATVCAHMGRMLVEARYFEEAQAVFQEATTIYQRFSTEGIDPDDVPSEAFAAPAA